MKDRNTDRLLQQYRQTRDPSDLAAIFDTCAEPLFATPLNTSKEAPSRE